MKQGTFVHINAFVSYKALVVYQKKEKYIFHEIVQKIHAKTGEKSVMINNN